MPTSPCWLYPSHYRSILPNEPGARFGVAVNCSKTSPSFRSLDQSAIASFACTIDSLNFPGQDGVRNVRLAEKVRLKSSLSDAGGLSVKFLGWFRGQHSECLRTSPLPSCLGSGAYSMFNLSSYSLNIFITCIRSRISTALANF